MSGLIDEIYEQPDALHRLLNAAPAILPDLAQWGQKLKQATQQQIRRVVFTGMGSSFYAAYPALIYLLQHGIDAQTIEASELYYDYRLLLDKTTLLIAISQSGRSIEIGKLVDEVSGKVPIIGVTNDPESPLAQQSNSQFLIYAGQESTVSTKTYTCTLAALHILARALVGSDSELDGLRYAADRIGENLPAWSRQIDDLVVQTEPNRFLVFIGRGPSRATAMTGALITKETAKVPTEGIVGGQFGHGPREVIGAGITALIFAGAGPARNLNLTLVKDLGKTAGKAVLIDNQERTIPNVISLDLNAKELDQWTLPLAEIIPIQLFAAQLAAARGLEAGKFFFGQKITTTE